MRVSMAIVCRLAGMDSVRQQLFILSSVRESPAILVAHILAAGAQPYHLVLKVCLLARSEVPSFQVMQSTHLVVTILVQGEVAQP